MKPALRIALVVAIVAAYAFLLSIFLLMLLGPGEVRTLGEVVRGDRCSADCSPRHVIGIIGICAPFVATLGAVVWVGIVWIRRRAQRDRELAHVDTWLATAPPVTQPDPPAEPEPQRFYRDRQGRLRPLQSAGDED